MIDMNENYVNIECTENNFYTVLSKVYIFF